MIDFDVKRVPHTQSLGTKKEMGLVMRIETYCVCVCVFLIQLDKLKNNLLFVFMFVTAILLKSYGMCRMRKCEA